MSEGKYGGDDAGVGAAAGMELEHVIGYSGHFRDTILHVPSQPDTCIMSMGTVVVIQDLNDPHRQEFLRGHDEEITALAITASGSLVASGQKGSTFHKGDKAQVLVWDLERRVDLFQLEGLVGSVVSLAFSPDGRYLAALGFNNVLYVWDMQSGEIVVASRYPSAVGIVKWVSADLSKR